MRKERTKLTSGRKIAVTITRRYLLDSGCSKFGRTPGGGGKALTISALVAKGIGFMVSLFNKSNKRLSH
jgi:hypothetical protein